jgi:tetratricopeptide (TPR) repeat protein
MNQLEDLLKECTVQIRVPSRKGWGTGFYVAMDLILTCDHVVSGADNGAVEIRCPGKTEWESAAVEKTLPNPYDLALLRVAALPEGVIHPPCVFLDEHFQPRDPLYLFGFPDDGDCEGEPRTFYADGSTGSNIASILFNLGQVRPGMSGSALLNQRTHKVCGMVQFSRDRSIDLGGGALSARVILEQLPELRDLQRNFHQNDRRWRDHLKWDGPPYPGLTVFEKADAPIFFGRHDDIQEGIEELGNLRDREERLFIYLGASGSGKSSLIRAGLVPELENPIHADSWIVVPPFRPINEGLGNPFENLAVVLSEAFAEGGSPCDSESILQILITSQQRHGLLEVVRALAKVSQRRNATVLIIIDQFEELLGQTASDEAKAFLAWFDEAMVSAQQLSLKVPPLLVLATMRSDFLPAFQQCALQPSVKTFTKLVSPIPVRRFGELIEGPASLVDLKLGPGLVQAIINDAHTDNSMPLMAFTLRSLYEKYGKQKYLGIDEYNEYGRLTGAISLEAQKVFDNFLRANKLTMEEGKRLLRQALLKLVRLDTEGKAARRMASWRELPVAAQPLIEKFVARRLLTTTIDEEKFGRHGGGIQHTDTLVEVSHEALFTEWGLLRECIDEIRDYLHDKQRIEAAAKEWQNTSRPKELLLTGERLEKATAFASISPTDLSLNEVGQEFLAVSQRENAVQVFFGLAHSTSRSIASPLKRLVSLVAISRAQSTAGVMDEAEVSLDQALAIARGLGDSAEKGHMIVEIAIAAQQFSDANQQLKRIFSLVSGLHKSIVAIAQAPGLLSDPQSAQPVLENATTTAETIDDASYRCNALTEIAKVYGHLSDPQSAQVVLKKATTTAETIDDYSCRNALIEIAKAAGQLADPPSAQAVLEKATAAAESIHYAPYRINALSTIAHVYCQSSDQRTAHEVLEKATTAAETIDDASDRSYALIEIGQAYGQLSDPQVVQAVLEKATTAAETIDDATHRSKVLSEIVKAAGNLSDSKSAQAVLEKATTAAETINFAPYVRKALIEIARVYCQLSDPQSAHEVLEKATTSAQTIDDTSSLSDALGEIVKAAGQLIDPQSAQAVLEKATTAAETIDDASYRSKVLSEIAQVYGQLSDPESAQEVLKNAINTAETIDGASERSDALSGIAQVYGQLSEPQLALAILEKATTAAETILDADYRSYVLSAIAQDYGKLSDSQSAQRVLEKATSAAETNDDVCSSDALIEIARVYDQISELQSALAILEKATTAAETIDHAYSRIYALGKIAQAYGQLSDLQSAQGVLEKATIAAEAIDRASDRHDALNEIVNAAVNLSVFQSPQAVLERATTAAETIEDAYSRSYNLKEIAQAYGQLSKLKAAQAVLEKATIAAETIKDVYSRSDALSAILTVSQCLGPYQTLLDNLPDTPSEQMVFLDNALSDVDGNNQRSNTSRHEIS